jgi:hypothetical protein
MCDCSSDRAPGEHHEIFFFHPEDAHSAEVREVVEGGLGSAAQSLAGELDRLDVPGGCTTELLGHEAGCAQGPHVQKAKDCLQQLWW